MKNIVLTSLRQLKKNALFTLLNIVGLAIGISASWIVFEVVRYEYSFDRQLPALEHKYQLVTGDELDPEDIFVGIPLGLPPLLAEQQLDDALLVPVYSEYYRQLYIPQADGTEKMWDDQEKFKSILPSYFEFIPYEWLAGQADQALLAPESVVLTQERAERYYPDLTPEQTLGKTLRIDSTKYTITGIIKKPSFPISFEGEGFFRIKNKDWNDHNWHGMNSNHTYYIQSKDPKIVEQLLQVAQDRYEQVAAKDHAQYGVKNVFKAIPVQEKHFTPALDVEGIATDKKILYGLMAIGGFLIALAAINYINLSTALIPNRAKEICIRKTLGASPKGLSWQFFIETLLITSIALLLSWPLVWLFKTLYPEFIPQEMASFTNPWWVVGFLFVLVLTISFLSALYPSYLIKGMRAIETLKGRVDTKVTGGKLTLRKSFIVFQFIIAQFFIICALVMNMQLRYTLHKDLGFDHDAVIHIQMPYKAHHNANTDPFIFKHAIQQEPLVQNITLGHDPQSQNHWGTAYLHQVDSGKVQLQAPRKYADADYVSFFKMDLVAGRNYIQTDTTYELVINEAAVKKLGYSSPEQVIGTYLEAPYERHKMQPIVGVVKDFHQKSLHQEIEPLILMSSSDRQVLQFFHLRLPQERHLWKESLARIEKIWTKVYPNAPFSYTFADERIKNLYQNEYKTTTLIGLATGITILISCFGLMTLTAFQRIKEIGIRKVLGASVPNIVHMLSKEFIVLIGIALLITIPMAYYAMHQWLESFSFKIDLSWWIFAMGGVGAILIALLTISYQAIRAALANPVDSLRDE